LCFSEKKELREFLDMAAGKRASSSPSNQELPAMASEREMCPVDMSESHTNAGISVDEICEFVIETEFVHHG
jgi:hypothetical protein